MTRDELYTLGYHFDNAHNTCASIVEYTSDTERGPDLMEMLTIRQNLAAIDAFRAEMNVKYGAGTL